MNRLLGIQSLLSFLIEGWLRGLANGLLALSIQPNNERVAQLFRSNLLNLGGGGGGGHTIVAAKKDASSNCRLVTSVYPRETAA